ncbi:MAG: CDP-diacylglycerol--serine O-phosphatidyltransferase [Candidatus Nanoarchaeia archaeon]
MRYKELVKAPDFLTLGNLTLGVLSIIFSIKKDFNTAATMMIAAVFLDFLDGRVARMMRREGNFGKELDSLCDLVSFGVAPAIFVYQAEVYSILTLIILVFFVCAGALRLARFNITEMKDYYNGLPITNAGWIIPLWYFIRLPYITFVILVIGILFISPIRIKKVI